MGLVVTVVIVAFVIWLVLRRKPDRERASANPTTPSAPASGSSAAKATSGLQSGKSFTMTGRTYRLSRNGRVSVVGERYRTKEMARVVKGQRVASAGDWDNALRRDAVLVPEPTNKHDKNAVRVLIEVGTGWEHVGYLSASDAADYVGLCNDLIGQGRVPFAESRIVKSPDGHGVYLHLADADNCLFTNDEPECDVVDARRQCAVTREGDHQDVLGALSHGLYWATLHSSTVTSGKYAGDFTIEARINNRRVGELTAAQGDRYRSLLSTAEPVACEANVFAGKSMTEVNLYLPQLD